MKHLIGQILLHCCVTIVSAMCAISSFADTLIPCPDCGCEVSRRALMCPNCGLKGDVISEVARTIPEPLIGDVLKVICDGKLSYALPVEMDGRKFAVMPLDFVLGATHLKLECEGKSVMWTVPELAIDAPIVRLQLADTNLTYWTCGGTLAFDGTRIKAKGNEVASIISPIVATNAFPLANHEWQVLQPRQMKVHGRQILKMLKGEASELPQSTHPYFKMIENQEKETAK